jgi:hypothetical protein
MSIQFTNDATTFLASNINASVTTITVVDASSFPTLASGDHTYITLSTPTNSTKEIVKCTAIVGNTLTVIRAQEGTTAASFTTEDRAQIRITAQLFRDIMLAYSSLNSYRYTATAGQTTFTGTDIHSATLAYLPNNIIVMLNGVGMGTVDYTATDGSSIVFNVGATLNDEITIVAFTAFGVSDHYKKSETDALLAGKVDDSQVLTNVPSGALFTDTAYTHPANHAISVITGLQAALDGKVDDSQVLTNVPSGALFTDTNTVYTHPSNHAISVITGLQAALDGKTTESYVNTAVANLVDSSPASLNTLNELATALGDDANFSTTTATALGLRVAKDSDTGAASMPTGTTAQRPTGALGMFRHNTTLNQFEGYNDGAWGALAGGGEVSFVTYEYIATAGQTTFSGADSNNLTLAYTVANIIVSYGGQDLPHSDYTATNGTSVVLDDGAVAGEIVRIVAFTTFTVADTYTQAQIDSKDATKAPIASPVFTGNVGVGTSASNAKLEVAASSGEVFRADAAGGAYRLVVNQTGVNMNGNVGINTSSPEGKLTIDYTAADLPTSGTTSNSAIQVTSSLGNQINIGLNTAPSYGAYIQASDNNLAAHYPLNLQPNGGNVGIGVTPEAWHSSVTAIDVGTYGSIYEQDEFNITSNSYLNASSQETYKNTDEAVMYKQTASGKHLFKVAPSGTADSAISWTTAMKIDNDAQVFVGASQFMVGKGTAIGGYGATFYPTGSANNMVVVYNKDYNSGSVVMFFQTLGNTVGTIQSTASSTSYNTSSDYRLKTDVQPMTGAADRVKLLKPCNFEWINTGERVDGFLAHEAQEVVPEAVTGTKDAMMDEEYEVTPATDTEEAVMGTRSVPDMQGIDQSKLVPLLTATIQELIARIEALEGAAP